VRWLGHKIDSLAINNKLAVSKGKTEKNNLPEEELRAA